MANFLLAMVFSHHQQPNFLQCIQPGSQSTCITGTSLPSMLGLRFCMYDSLGISKYSMVAISIGDLPMKFSSQGSIQYQKKEKKGFFYLLQVLLQGHSLGFILLVNLANNQLGVAKGLEGSTPNSQDNLSPAKSTSYSTSLLDVQKLKWRACAVMMPFVLVRIILALYPPTLDAPLM